MNPSSSYTKVLKKLRNSDPYTYLYCHITHKGKGQFGHVYLSRDTLSAQTLDKVWPWGDGTIPIDAEIQLVAPSKKTGEKFSVNDLMATHIPDQGDQIAVWEYPRKVEIERLNKEDTRLKPKLVSIVHCTSACKSQPCRFRIGGGWGDPLTWSVDEKLYQIATLEN